MAKDEKNKNKKNVKEQKSSFIKESRAELKKVSWPTPKELANDTATVIGIVLVVAIIVVILDFLFLRFNEDVLYKAEQNIRNKATTTQVVEQPNNEENQEQNNETPDSESNPETTENAE
jgi:preprotein translocase subunit SecE